MTDTNYGNSGSAGRRLRSVPVTYLRVYPNIQPSTLRLRPFFIKEKPSVSAAEFDHCDNGCRFQVIYAWAKNAPKLVLPPGVAFHVGKTTGLKYLTLQVHYADVTAFQGRSHNVGFNWGGASIQVLNCGSQLKSTLCVVL